MAPNPPPHLPIFTGLLLESGRILIASDHMAGAQKEWGSHAMLSDDNGKSWALSNDMEGGNECQASLDPPLPPRRSDPLV